MRISDWSSDVCSSDLSRNAMFCNSVCKPYACEQRHDGYRKRKHAEQRETGVAYIETYAFQSVGRSEEHTSELQSLMRISYAVFCLKKKTTTYHHNTIDTNPHVQSLIRTHRNQHITVNLFFPAI